MNDYVYQEYPKALYLNGVYKQVESADEEVAARADGWMNWYDDYLAMTAPDTFVPASQADVPAVMKRRGRPPKPLSEIDPFPDEPPAA